MTLLVGNGLLLGVVCAAGGDALPESPQCVTPEPGEYRMSDFRAATPCTLGGGEVLDSDTLASRLARGPVLLIDVLPAQRRPAHLAEDALWLPPLRFNLPGSVWLPNTGFGLLPVEEERYLRDNLERLTSGDLDVPLVFYCESECWMSWNAARRAIQWGYRAVSWYPGGSDMWEASGRPLARSQPVPRSSGQ